MKKLKIISGVLLALLFIIIVSSNSNKKTNIPNSNTTTTALTNLINNPDDSTTTTLLKNEEKKDNVYLVTRVIDGDTIEIEGGQKVRYIGIDTPETLDPRKPVQCFGVEASNYNKQLVEGKRVRLEKDISETDKYGRLLRYVYLGDVFINLKLVQEGYASSYSYPPDIKHQEQFVEAQKMAREQNKGLWAKCNDSVTTTTVVKTTTTLPLISNTTTSAPAVNKSSSCDIKGNINTSGEKIYHMKGCGSYTQTDITEARGERWFCSESEAISAGWRKAKNCP